MAVEDAEQPSPTEHIVEHAAEHGAEPALGVPTVSAMDRLAAAARRPHRPPGLLAAWVLTAVILVAALAATVTWREAVVRAWPPSGRVLGSADPAPPGPGVSPNRKGNE